MDEHFLSSDLARTGLEMAIGRSQGDDYDPIAALVAVAEAIFWIVSFDEWHRLRLGLAPAPYCAMRDRDGRMGATVGALRWLRNRVAHELQSVIDLGPSAASASEVRRHRRTGAVDWRWRPLNDISARAGRLGAGADLYASQLAGGKVYSSLVEAYEYLEGDAYHMGSHRPRGTRRLRRGR